MSSRPILLLVLAALGAAPSAAQADGTAGAGLTYLSFLGGSLTDEVLAVARGPGDTLLLAGTTTSAAFPTTSGATQRALAGYSDAFVAAVDLASGELLWSTLLGGNDPGFLVREEAAAVALDPSGDVWIAGAANSADFPATPGAVQVGVAGGTDAFVARLHPGGALAWCSLLGGSANDRANALAAGGGGVVLAGRTASKGGGAAAPFPTTPGAFDTSFNSLFFTDDAFVARLSGDGATLEWSTFLGGTVRDEAFALALRADGGALVAGLTTSSDFPATPGAFDPGFNGPDAGESDGFVARLLPDGSALAFASFLGGADVDELRALALDASGAVVVAGSTLGADVPVTPGAAQPASAGGRDALLARLSADGATLELCTYLGGGGDDEARGLALGAFGELVVAGRSASADFPVTAGGGAPAGGQDAFVAKLPAAGGALLHAALLGGAGDDEACGLALDGFGAALLGGTTDSAALPVTPDAHDASFGGALDGLVARLALPPWANVGFSKAGGGGLHPRLVGTGTLATGTPGALTLSQAKPGALWYLFVGFAEGYLPFKQGTLVPFPVSITLALPTLPDGSLPLAWPAWPALPPGLALAFQGWIADPGATAGASATNGLRGVQP